MFPCCYDTGFFAYAIDFGQNFKTLSETNFEGWRESLYLYTTITNMHHSSLGEEELQAPTPESTAV